MRNALLICLIHLTFLSYSQVAQVKTPGQLGYFDKKVVGLHVDYIFLGSNVFADSEDLVDSISTYYQDVQMEHSFKMGADIRVNTASHFQLWIRMLALVNPSQIDIRESRSFRIGGYQYGVGISQNLFPKKKFSLEFGAMVLQSSIFLNFNQFNALNGNTLSQLSSNSQSFRLRAVALSVHPFTSFRVSVYDQGSISLWLGLNMDFGWYLTHDEIQWKETIHQQSVDLPFFEQGVFGFDFVLSCRIRI